MFRALLPLVSTMFLVACDAPSSPSQAIQAPRASAAPQTSQVGGTTFRVLRDAGSATALVGATSGSPSFTGNDVIAAASNVTGCTADIIAGEWAFLGDLKPFQLGNLRAPVRRPFPAWQVALTC